MKKIIFLTIILAAFVTFYGYYEYNRPFKNLTKAKADLTIGANELLVAYESNESKANTIYLDKVIEVHGKISKIESTEGKAQITLETQNPMSGIICEMTQNSQLGDMHIGNIVTIKGMCTGYLSDVILNQAVLVNK
jgi:hypothetical protein